MVIYRNLNLFIELINVLESRHDVSSASFLMKVKINWKELLLLQTLFGSETGVNRSRLELHDVTLIRYEAEYYKLNWIYTGKCDLVLIIRSIHLFAPLQFLWLFLCCHAASRTERQFVPSRWTICSVLEKLPGVSLRQLRSLCSYVVSVCHRCLWSAWKTDFTFSSL